MTLPDIAISEPRGDAGSPLLLLGPSLGTASAVLWEDVALLLSPYFRVATWDLPGHGFSPDATVGFSVWGLADVLAGHARALGGPVLAAGVSLGGAVTQALAIRHPDQIASAAVIGTAADFTDDADYWRARAECVRRQGTSALIRLSAERWFAPGSIAARPVITGRLLHTLADADDESYARCCEALAGFDARAELGDIRAPLLVAHGADDSALAIEKAEQIADAVAGASFLRIPGAGHLPPAERPDEVAAALREHFEKGPR